MEALLLLTMGVMCILCFIVGASVGQKAVRGEDINVTTITPPNPFEALREREETRRAEKEAKREADRMATILENIERYDGTSAGQTDVPRG